jgi:hypothetical protein
MSGNMENARQNAECRMPAKMSIFHMIYCLPKTLVRTKWQPTSLGDENPHAGGICLLDFRIVPPNLLKSDQTIGNLWFLGINENSQSLLCFTGNILSSLKPLLSWASYGTEFLWVSFRLLVPHDQTLLKRTNFVVRQDFVWQKTFRFWTAWSEFHNVRNSV